MKMEHSKDDNMNFFDFIEADTDMIFGGSGVFTVFNIYNSINISNNTEANMNEIYSEMIIEIFNKVKANSSNTFGYILSNKDFIIIKPNCDKKDICKIIMKVADEFNKSTLKGKLSNIKLIKNIYEYDSPFPEIVDFYDFLFMNAMNDRNNLSSRILIKNMLGTFTNNIKNTLNSYRTANSLALHDEISGLSNNRAGKIYLSGLIEEHHKKQKEFSIMFIDGDNLKRYNQISYESGNQMIKYLGQIITNALRDEDKVFRWLSGDEFIVVANDIGKEDTFNLAERIRKTVEEKTMDNIYPITISIGVVHYPSDGDAIDELICRAEKANRDAKMKGKNMVVIYE